MIGVDLFGSEFDTKIYIYDEEMNVVACNDDFYDDYVSRLEWVELSTGVRYYLVIDGYYTSEFGTYDLAVFFNELPVPTEVVPEGEPTLYPGYIDNYNDGCYGDPPLFQPLHGDTTGSLEFLGHTGWVASSLPMDFDCYAIRVGASGTVELEIWAQIKTYVFEILPLDCAQAVVGQTCWAISNRSTTMVVAGPPGSVHWLGVWPGWDESPAVFSPPEYSYLMEYSGLEAASVAIERVPLGELKNRFR